MSLVKRRPRKYTTVGTGGRTSPRQRPPAVNKEGATRGRPSAQTGRPAPRRIPALRERGAGGGGRTAHRRGSRSPASGRGAGTERLEALRPAPSRAPSLSEPEQGPQAPRRRDGKSSPVGLVLTGADRHSDRRAHRAGGAGHGGLRLMHGPAGRGDDSLAPRGRRGRAASGRRLRRSDGERVAPAPPKFAVVDAPGAGGAGWAGDRPGGPPLRADAGRARRVGPDPVERELRVPLGMGSGAGVGKRSGPGRSLCGHLLKGGGALARVVWGMTERGNVTRITCKLPQSVGTTQDSPRTSYFLGPVSGSHLGASPSPHSKKRVLIPIIGSSSRVV